MTNSFLRAIEIEARERQIAQEISEGKWVDPQFEHDMIFERQSDEAKAVLLINAASFALSAMIVFVFGSITAGTADISQWTQVSRGFAVFFTILGYGILLALCFAVLDDFRGQRKHTKDVKENLYEAREDRDKMKRSRDKWRKRAKAAESRAKKAEAALMQS